MARGGPDVRAGVMAAVMRLSRSPDASRLTAFCRELTELLGTSGVRLLVVPSDLVDASVPGPDGLEYGWPPTGPAGRTAQRVPVTLAGEPVGELVLLAGSAKAAQAAQAALIPDAVAALGPVLHLVRMEAERARALARARYLAEKIAAARRVALAERDRERRDLERDLHDGAQHHLVSLQMAVALLEVQLDAGNTPAARASLARLRSGVGAAERSLLEMAAGSCPPILIEQGVPAALSAELGSSELDGRPDRTGLSIRIHGGPRRFPLVAETAVYFTCLEAVNNARKHAPGARLVVVLRSGRDGLAFRVTDDGPGLTQRTLDDSFGLNNMRARIEAVGGKLEIRTELGSGTTVDGFVPA